MPTQDVTASAKSPLVPGPNNPRLGGFTLAPLYLYGINYFPYNFNSNSDNGNAGKIFSQLYFRQAMQTLIDQPLFINKVFHGYAVPTYGPVPVLPPTYASTAEASNPYPLQRLQGQEPPGEPRVDGRRQRHLDVHGRRDGVEPVRGRDPQGCCA